MERILGYDWDAIQKAQAKQDWRPKINLSKPGDYGADPVGDGTFRMVPSGDIVDLDERNRRLAR